MNVAAQRKQSDGIELEKLTIHRGEPTQNDLLVEGPVAVERSVVIERKIRKTPTRRCMPLHLLTAHVVMLNPAKVAASHPSNKKRTPAFSPRLVLTKHSVGRTCKEYQAEESVFSQGAASDAVFYILRGRVKLTVVSKSGKEAVVAILPEASFFGEGCLAGQPIRMSTASADQKSTIVRVKKRAMIALLHQEPEFLEHFLTHLLSRNIRMEADLVDHIFNSSEKPCTASPAAGPLW